MHRAPAAGNLGRLAGLISAAKLLRRAAVGRVGRLGDGAARLAGELLRLRGIARRRVAFRGPRAGRCGHRHVRIGFGRRARHRIVGLGVAGIGRAGLRENRAWEYLAAWRVATPRGTPSFRFRRGAPTLSSSDLVRGCHLTSAPSRLGVPRLGESGGSVTGRVGVPGSFCGCSGSRGGGSPSGGRGSGGMGMGGGSPSGGLGVGTSGLSGGWCRRCRRHGPRHTPPLRLRSAPRAARS